MGKKIQEEKDADKKLKNSRLSFLVILRNPIDLFLQIKKRLKKSRFKEVARPPM